MARELILKLGKKITDRMDVKLGMTKLDENSPEYYGLASGVTDEMAEGPCPDHTGRNRQEGRQGSRLRGAAV